MRHKLIQRNFHAGGLNTTGRVAIRWGNVEKWVLMHLPWRYDPFKSGGGKLGDPPASRRSLESETVRQTRLQEYDEYELRALFYYQEYYPEYLAELQRYAYNHSCDFVAAQMAIEPPIAQEQFEEHLGELGAPAWLVQAVIYGHYD